MPCTGSPRSPGCRASEAGSAGGAGLLGLAGRARRGLGGLAGRGLAAGALAGVGAQRRIAEDLDASAALLELGDVAGDGLAGQVRGVGRAGAAGAAAVRGAGGGLGGLLVTALGHGSSSRDGWAAHRRDAGARGGNGGGSAG